MNSSGEGHADLGQVLLFLISRSSIMVSRESSSRYSFPSMMTVSGTMRTVFSAFISSVRSPTLSIMILQSIEILSAALLRRSGTCAAECGRSGLMRFDAGSGPEIRPLMPTV